MAIVNSENIADEVCNGGCNDHEQNEQRYLIIKPFLSDIESIADGNLHQANEFSSPEACILIKSIAFVCGKEIDADGQASQTPWYDISKAKYPSLCFDVSKVAFRPKSFAPSLEFFQIDKLLKYHHNGHDKRGRDYGDEGLNCGLDDVL